MYVDLRDIIMFNVKCLHCFGYFSPKFSKLSQKILYRVYAFMFISFTYVLCVASQIANMVVVFGDIEKMTEVSYILLTICNQSLKNYVFLIKGRKVHSFIESMNREEFKPNNRQQYKILSDEIRTSKSISKVFLSMCFVTCSLWGIFPFLDRMPAEKIRLPLSGWYPFSTDEAPSFQIVYAYQIFSTCVNGMGNISMDTFISGILMFISGQLSVLNDAFRTLKTEIQHSEEPNEKFIKNVVHYKNIIQFASEMTGLFTACLMSQFVVGVVIICVTMFQMSLVSVLSLQFFSILLYQSCILLEIFLFCYYGNEIIVKSNQLTESAYTCEWIQGNRKFKQNLLFFMTRTQIPMQLYAGGYFTLSLPTYVAILKSSWSYFAVLNSVHSK